MDNSTDYKTIKRKSKKNLFAVMIFLTLIIGGYIAVPFICGWFSMFTMALGPDIYPGKFYSQLFYIGQKANPRNKHPLSPYFKEGFFSKGKLFGKDQQTYRYIVIFDGVMDKNKYSFILTKPQYISILFCHRNHDNTKPTSIMQVQLLDNDQGTIFKKAVKLESENNITKSYRLFQAQQIDALFTSDQQTPSREKNLICIGSIDAGEKLPAGEYTLVINSSADSSSDIVAILGIGDHEI